MARNNGLTNIVIDTAKEFGDKFLEIRLIVEATTPHLLHAAEHSVSRVELATLQTEHVLGCHSDQIEEHIAGSAVVGTIQKGWRYSWGRQKE